MSASALVQVSASRKLVEEALSIAQTHSRRELMDIALQELINTQRQRKLLDLYGEGIAAHYDYKASRTDAAD